LIAPAFFEAGRYTINDIHWVDQKDGLVSAERTEFAHDPVFGYTHGNLREWVEEKTGGAIKAQSVRSISLSMIRTGGPEAVAEELMCASGAEPIIMNAACYEDLEVVVLGAAQARCREKPLHTVALLVSSRSVAVYWTFLASHLKSCRQVEDQGWWLSDPMLIKPHVN